MADANLLFRKFIFRQKCIPVRCSGYLGEGCVPGGGRLFRGVSAWGHLHKGCLPREDGRCLPRGVCPEGVSA